MADVQKPERDDEDFLADVRKKFERAAEAEEANRARALDDIKFARIPGNQWPERIRNDREADGLPCHEINKLPSFIRQVVNSARQNRPAITVIPVDSAADKATAEIMSGLIRNIEVASDADIAYDTAVDCAVTGGFGYIRINTAYTSDDSFDQDIVIERVADPFTVYGDPASESADGSDWNCAFVVKTLTKDEFEEKYNGADAVDWEGLGYKGLAAPWIDGDNVMVAEYWHRREEEGQIVALSDGTVVAIEEFQERAAEYQALGIVPVGEPRTVKRKKVKQYVLSGAEVLDELDWPGRYIPIVPVYGDEFTVEGERHLKSLITDAKSTQQELNYWRSKSTEAVALAPQAPFIGPKDAFNTDIEKWRSANRRSHAFIEYDGAVPPQRQSPTMPPVAEMQQAATASDDMKAIIGLYDPSLGAQSNETSGIAIRQRQRQGDIGTFHFVDNLSRSIRQAGRILIDLIGKVYTTERVIRVLGQDMEPQQARIAPDARPMAQQQAAQQQAAQIGQQIATIYNLTAGKYDLVVKAGPSYSTQREYAQAEIVELTRAAPQTAPALIPMYLENSDWPGADKAAERLIALTQGGGPEQAKAMQQQMGQMQQAIQQGQAQLQEAAQQRQQLELENRELKAQFSLKARELDIKDKEANTKAAELVVRQQEAYADRAANLARAQAQQPGNPFAMNGSGQLPTQ